MDFSNIKQVIYELTKKNYKSLLAMAFSIFVMLALTLTFDLLLPGSFFLLFFVLVLPFVISMIITNLKLKVTNNFEGKDFYHNYRIGFILGSGGTFRVFRSYLVGLIYFILITFFISFIAIEFKMIDPSEFVTLYKSFIASPNNESTVDAFVNYISDPRQPFIFFMYVVILLGYAIALFAFIYQIYRNILIFYIQSNFGCSKHDALGIFRSVYPKIKKPYHHIMLSSLWPVLIIYPACFVIGASLMSYFTLKVNLLIFGGCFLVCLGLSFMLPYAITTQDVCFSILAPYFLVEAKDSLLRSLQEINLNEQIPEDQKEIFRGFYVEQIKQIDAIKSTIETFKETGVIKSDDVPAEKKEDSVSNKEKVKDNETPNENKDESLNKKVDEEKKEDDSSSKDEKK